MTGSNVTGVTVPVERGCLSASPATVRACIDSTYIHALPAGAQASGGTGAAVFAREAEKTLLGSDTQWSENLRLRLPESVPCATLTDMFPVR